MASKTCFVVAPVGAEGSETRKRSDQVLRHVVRPVVEAAGYEALRADEFARPGIISTKIVEQLADADLVVADLTDHNPNVFYELAIRHAIQKPLVQLIDSAQRLPFDIANMQTIFFDIHDLDSVESAKAVLASQIKELETDSRPIDTPVSVARDMKRLWESEEPAAKAVAELVSELRSELGTLRTEIVSQQRPRFVFPSVADPTASQDVTYAGKLFRNVDPSKLDAASLGISPGDAATVKSYLETLRKKENGGDKS